VFAEDNGEQAIGQELFRAIANITKFYTSQTATRARLPRPFTGYYLHFLGVWFCAVDVPLIAGAEDLTTLSSIPSSRSWIENLSNPSRVLIHNRDVV
jgi:hypothetical protein